MFVTPLIAALLIGSFWTGVGATAIVSNHDGLFDHSARSDVVITAHADDHFARCHARYRSYQEDSDQWLGNDGAWHACAL